jgi:hypothetical protein
VAGRKVCYHHGGASPSGLASPHFRTGRWSKALPARLRERYQEAVDDPDLLVLSHEIGAVDARLAELFAKLDSSESGDAWREANDLYLAARAAIRSGDANGLQAALDALGAVIRRGQGDYAAWDAIAEALDLRRRLVESERKRLVQLSQMITTEQAMVLMTAVVSLVKEHVEDRQALAAISEGIRRLQVIDSRLV